MPIIQSYNTRATGAALQLLGGDKLVNAFTALYNAFDQAEAQGHEDGYWLGKKAGYEDGAAETGIQGSIAFNDGYDTGYADGHSDGTDLDPTEDAIEEFNSEDVNDMVKTNAQAEGFKFLNEDHMHDWELAKAVAALG